MYYKLCLEMVALGVDKAVLVCWMPETTTVIEMQFSEHLWLVLWEILIDIYAQVPAKRPSKLHPRLKELKSEINQYIETHCKFLCEVESVKATPCHHQDLIVHKVENAHISHKPQREASDKVCEDTDQLVYDTEKCLNAAYNLSRDFAKQVLVVMLSDCDRIFKAELPHSCPIAYGFTGYSFTTDQAANILKEIRQKCNERGLNVLVQCFDGAFAKLAVRGEDGKPLTMLQLSKDVWSSACSLTKQSIVRCISEHGKVDDIHTIDDAKNVMDISVDEIDRGGVKIYGGPISVGKSHKATNVFRTPENWRDLLKSSKTFASTTVEVNSVAVDAEGTLTGSLSSALHLRTVGLSGMDEETITPDIADNTVLEDEKEGEDNSTTEEKTENECKVKSKQPFPLTENDKHLMWMSLTELAKHRNCSEEEFLQSISTVNGISKLKRDEILQVLKPMKEKLKRSGIRCVSSMRKAELIGIFCEITNISYTTCTTSIRKSQNPKTLQRLVKTYIETKLPKHFLNAAYATFTYQQEFPKWVQNGAFSAQCKVNDLTTPEFWYSQPNFITTESKFVLDFLDPEHLLTNMRSKVCTSGMPKAGISQQAWIEVAKEGKTNGTNLSVALVENVVDKQNVAFAEKIFSREVEEAMIELDYQNEASFCRRFRNWYKAQDEGGMSSCERHIHEQDLRKWLLQDVRFDIFPPPGKYTGQMF